MMLNLSKSGPKLARIQSDAVRNPDSLKRLSVDGEGHDPGFPAVGPIVCFARLSVETAEGSGRAISGSASMPRGRRNQSPVDAARFPRERGQKARGETKQFLYPRMEGPNLGDVRTVLALRGSISRNESLVEPAAVPRSSSLAEGTSRCTDPARKRLQLRREKIEPPGIRKPPVGPVGPADGRLPSERHHVRRPVAKNPSRRRANARHAGQGLTVPALPDAARRATGIQRSSAPCTSRLSKFGTHGPCFLRRDRRGGHSIVLGSRSVRRSRNHEAITRRPTGPLRPMRSADGGKKERPLSGPLNQRRVAAPNL